MARRILIMNTAESRLAKTLFIVEATSFEQSLTPEDIGGLKIEKREKLEQMIKTRQNNED